jgi:hypothetical protein
VPLKYVGKVADNIQVLTEILQSLSSIPIGNIARQGSALACVLHQRSGQAALVDNNVDHGAIFGCD